MRLSERIERLPVEEWAAAVGRLGRRTRRRIARRRGPILGLCLAAVLATAVAGNALFRQTAPHPAPLWGGDEGEMAVAAHGAPEKTPETSSLVSKVQEGLAQQGYLSGPASGILDERTRAAIADFEEAQGLPRTGEPSVALLAAVSSQVQAVPQSEPIPRLSVADMQRLLNENGFGPLEVDGLMGPRTERALARFAEARGIETSDPRSPALLRALAGSDA